MCLPPKAGVGLDTLRRNENVGGLPTAPSWLSECWVGHRIARKVKVLGPLLASLALPVLAQEVATPDSPVTPLYTTTTTGTLASAGATSYNVTSRPQYGGAYSGVAQLVINGGTLCSGALLGTGTQLLTAAHCVASFTSGTASFAVNPDPLNPYVGTSVGVAIQSVLVNPGYDGNTTHGSDLAIITLAAPAPAAAQRYSIYTGTGEIGQVSTKVGWGKTGNGTTGGTGAYEWRVGQNVYDATYFDWTFVAGSQNVLIYDFDNGTTTKNALQLFSSDLGRGSSELLAAPGDSGGPTFIAGQIAGITSFATGTGLFGEVGADTRVSAYANWILSAVPEPQPWVLWLAGLPVLGYLASRRRRDD